MNEFLRNFVMKTILEMIDKNKPEWEVRKFALDWYSKGILTEEDLQEIEDRYKPEPVEEPVDTAEETENSEETVENTEENTEEE
jgi:hypothetical protein